MENSNTVLCMHGTELAIGSCCPKEKRICCVSCKDDCAERCERENCEHMSTYKKESFYGSEKGLKSYGCTGCVWKNYTRHQKCSCCARNTNIKDNYEGG